MFNYTNPPIGNVIFGGLSIVAAGIAAVYGGWIVALFAAGSYIILDNTGEYSIIDNLMNMW